MQIQEFTYRSSYGGKVEEGGFMEQPMFSLACCYGERKLAWKRICNRRSVESRENPRFRLPHCCLTPPIQGTLSNIGVNLIFSVREWHSPSNIPLW